jgi:hypothetical protein
MIDKNGSQSSFKLIRLYVGRLMRFWRFHEADVSLTRFQPVFYS